MDVRGAVLWSVLILVAAGSSATPLQAKRAGDSGADLAYVEAGSGDTIVFVHGELQDYRIWDEHLEFFARKYRAVAYSRRNHFPNVSTKEGMPDNDADAHAADLAAFVNRLGSKRVYVVGHSSGAHVALFFAVQHPEMVKALVLHEPTAIGLLRESPLALTLYQELENKLAASNDAFREERTLDGVRLFYDGVFGEGQFDRLDDDQQAVMMANAASQAANVVYRELPKLLDCKMAKTVAAPVLLTSGTRTLPMYQRIVDELKRCLPNNEHVAIGAAHDMPMDEVRAFDKAAMKFLKQHP